MDNIVWPKKVIYWPSIMSRRKCNLSSHLMGRI